MLAHHLRHLRKSWVCKSPQIRWKSVFDYRVACAVWGDWISLSGSGGRLFCVGKSEEARPGWFEHANSCRPSSIPPTSAKNASKRLRSWYESGPAKGKNRSYICYLCGLTTHETKRCYLRKIFQEEVREIAAQKIGERKETKIDRTEWIEYTIGI